MLTAWTSSGRGWVLVPRVVVYYGASKLRQWLVLHRAGRIWGPGNGETTGVVLL